MIGSAVGMVAVIILDCADTHEAYKYVVLGLAFVLVLSGLSFRIASSDR